MMRALLTLLLTLYLSAPAWGQALRASPYAPSYAGGYARSAAESAHPELWRGLVGAWVPVLGPSGTTLRDVSGGGHHGTLTNMDPATDWVIGGAQRVPGYVLDFDGSNDYVILPPPLSATPFSLIAVFSTSSGAAAFRDFASQANTADNNHFVVLQLTSSQTVSFAIRAGNHLTQNTATSTGTYNDGAWHVAMGVARAVNDIELYVDGQSVATATTDPGGFPTTNAATIGAQRRVTTSNYFPGTLAAVVAYHRALSPAEIALHSRDPLAFLRLRNPAATAVVAGAGAAPAGTRVIIIGQPMQKPRTVLHDPLAALMLEQFRQAQRRVEPVVAVQERH